MAASAPKDSCMFCGEIHRGACGTAPKKTKAPRPPKPAPEVTRPVEPQVRPSKLDRMRAEASTEWKPTVESVARPAARRRPVAAPGGLVERRYHAALDPDTVAINGAVRALAAASMLSDEQVKEWSEILTTSPSLEEEKLLWKLRITAER